MAGGDLGPLFFYFWASVTWCLKNVCFTHHKHHENQLDESGGGKGRGGNTNFLMSFWGRNFPLPYESAGQVIGSVTLRETRGSWQLSWNVIKRGLCCGTTYGPGRITWWEWHWSRQVGWLMWGWRDSGREGCHRSHSKLTVWHWPTHLRRVQDPVMWDSTYSSEGVILMMV